LLTFYVASFAFRTSNMIAKPRITGKRKTLSLRRDVSNSRTSGAKRKPTPSVRTATPALRRDSTKQLNIALGRAIYEKARSRWVRQRDALEQSGNSDSAVALGSGRNVARNGSLVTTNNSGTQEVGEMENAFQQKSFVRGAKIRHELKLKRQQQQLKIKQRKPSRVSATSSPDKYLVVERGPARKEGHRQKVIHNHPKGQSQSISKPETRKRETPKRNQENAKQQQRKKLKHKPKAVSETQKNSSATKPHVLPIKPKIEFEVIDLLTSDSDSDSDGDEQNDNRGNGDTASSDSLLALTELLEEKAIGRGADRNEMRAYARNLFRLGLHSKEMILDALNSDDVDCNNPNTMSGIVFGWKWMKPFHKTIFRRWVLTEQQRQRMH